MVGKNENACATDTWVGLVVDDFLVEREVPAGRFSRLYSAVSVTDNTSRRLFKIAAPNSVAATVPEESLSSMRALSLYTGAYADVQPDTRELLTHQHASMRQDHSAVFPKVYDLKQTNECVYFAMEFIAGPTWRELLQTAQITYEHLSMLVFAVAKMRAGQIIHGDLKPENVLIDTVNRICETGTLRLVDPGYFGPLNCAEGKLPKCAVTTPLYYPKLEPDDLLALGLILWEALVGYHPLSTANDAQRRTSLLPIGESLRVMEKRYALAGRHFLRGLIGMPSPIEVLPPHRIATGLSEKIMGLCGVEVRNGVREATSQTAQPNLEELASELHRLGDRKVAEDELKC